MIQFNKQNVFLGITPTGWSNDDLPTLGDTISFEQCISEIALAGYQGCSVGHKFPKNTSELKHALELRGLRISEPWASTYFTANSMEEQTYRNFSDQMNFIREMGGTHLVVAELAHAVHQLPVAVLPNQPVFTQEQWNALTEGLNRLGELAARSQMQLCYHPHVGTGVQSISEIDRLMAQTDPSLVYLLLDTGHLYYAGHDPLEVAVSYAKRIKHVHLKDIRKDVLEKAKRQGMSFLQSIEAGVFTVPGDGAIDFEPILDVLARNGFEGWLMVEAEQDPSKANPLEYAKKGREYLRKVVNL